MVQCFISGILLCILSVSGGTNLVMKLIPKSIKIGTIVGMGLQIAFVGMTSVNIIVDDLYTLVTLGSLGNYELWLTFMGLVLIASLMHHDVKGAILIGMVVLSLITWWIEDSFPTSWVQWPVIKSELSHLVDLRSFDFNLMGPAVASFLFVGLVDVSGVVIGLSSLAGLSDGTGAVPGSIYAFIGCGVGTIVGAATGSSPVIVYVESAAGIKEGGRTGLAALTTGFLFAASLFLAPIFSQVPTTATAPVAILIGTSIPSIIFLYLLLSLFSLT